MQAADPAPADAKIEESEWDLEPFEELQQQLHAQRHRAPRVRIPTAHSHAHAVPGRTEPRNRALGSHWSLVVSGQQPALGALWERVTATFGCESKQDPVFEGLVFWVVSRTLRCSYSMGHSEMLLERAGLDKAEIAKRTGQLAGGDWSSFGQAERGGFTFARKLTRRPWAINACDIRRLVARLGPERALDLVWWSSRCQFVTKVAEAFQLPLEHENVCDGQPDSALLR
jgi:hypothetical protein